MSCLSRVSCALGIQALYIPFYTIRLGLIKPRNMLNCVAQWLARPRNRKKRPSLIIIKAAFKHPLMNRYTTTYQRYSLYQQTSVGVYIPQSNVILLLRLVSLIKHVDLSTKKRTDLSSGTPPKPNPGAEVSISHSLPSLPPPICYSLNTPISHSFHCLQHTPSSRLSEFIL